jgi:hypothetical protein
MISFHDGVYSPARVPFAMYLPAICVGSSSYLILVPWVDIRNQSLEFSLPFDMEQFSP